MITKHVLIFGALFLTGCLGVYDDDFDCGVGKGVGCRSISQVNEMVNRGQVPLPETPAEETASTDESSDLDPHLKIDHLPPLEFLSAQSGMKVKRIPEKTLRLWIAPHEVEDGSFVEETYVNLVLSPGRWVNVLGDH